MCYYFITVKFNFSHQIRTYTKQLIEDTNGLLANLVNCNDRHSKIQKDRLVDEFTAALTAFQTLQRKAVDLQKNANRQAKAANVTISKPPQKSGSNTSNKSNKSGSLFEDNFMGSRGQSQVQMQEEFDLQAMEEQERTIRELEVCRNFIYCLLHFSMLHCYFCHKNCYILKELIV